MKIPFTNMRIEFQTYSYSQISIIPKKYSHYLVDMNNVCAFSDSDVYRMREKEVNQVFTYLMKTIYPNVVLLGEHGVGKSAIVQSIVHHVLNKKAPKELVGRHYIYWDVEKILAALSSEDKKLADKINDSFNFILDQKDNIVLIIDQIHLIACSQTLLYYFTLFRKSGIKLIGMTTEDEFYGFFGYHKIASTIDTIYISEPKSKKIYPMICEYVKILEARQNVSISKEMVNYIISVSSAFQSELRNPGLAINLIEKSMIIAKRRKHTEVTKKDVNVNFNFDFELYKNISFEEKRITAYHEAGHFIVSKMSEHIKNFKTKAITIVPSEGFLGLTMFEFEPEKQTSCDSDYFIDNIACDLAGRVAEIILQQGDGKEIKLTSGAYSDLKHATQTARDIVTEYGMIDTCGKNMTFFCNYDMSDLALLSEERKLLIEAETKKLIDEAFSRANNILNKNFELLELIAKALLENEVLDEKDLDRLCAQVLDKK